MYAAGKKKGRQKVSDPGWVGCAGWSLPGVGGALVCQLTMERLGVPRSSWSRKLGREDGKQPKPGDLIEIFRVTYKHWAVYIGEGNVVHLVTSEGASDVSTMPHKDQKGTVRKEKLKNVVGDSKWRINNYLDEECPPRCNNDIVKAACNLVDSELSYNLFSHNCEHFATEMRNGRAVSRQVEKAKAAGAAGLAAAAGAAGLGSLASTASRRRDGEQSSSAPHSAETERWGRESDRG
nr:phospholipase A and acyltransferase 4-like [Nothobranchius furzeri]